MRSLTLAAALAVALAIPAAQAAVTAETKAEREAVSAAKTDYIAARDKAKVEYAVAKTACRRLPAENRAPCIDEAKALRNRALAGARTTYNVSVAKARTKTKDG